MLDLFIELLQVSLGTREYLSRVPTETEWDGLFDEAQKQALVGVLATGLERLPNEQKPTKQLLLTWIGVTIQIEQQNVLTTPVCQRICSKYEKDGFISCVLKGQSNHRYYPENLKKRRSCGDVDIWVKPNDVHCKHPERTVCEYVQRNFNMNGFCWLHTSHEDESGVHVETHFRASFMSEPCKNRRFQNFFSEVYACRMLAEVDGFELPVMKVDEDVIYQMSHLYRHLIDEGVGLRQVVDYYWLLKTWNDKHTRTKGEIMRIVSWLGMKTFAGALMYVLREFCGLSEDLLLCPASVKEGRFLINEILISGNFGHADPCVGVVGIEGGYFRRKVIQASRRFKRNFRFLTSYPGEVLWEPIIRIYHLVWKKVVLW